MPISIRAIQDAVARHYNLTLDEMLSTRSKIRMQPRHIAMRLARKLTKQSFKIIGREFGGSGPCGVAYAVNRIEMLERLDPELADDIRAIEMELLNQP